MSASIIFYATFWRITRLPPTSNPKECWTIPGSQRLSPSLGWS